MLDVNADGHGLPLYCLPGGLVFDTVLFMEWFAIIQETACTTTYIICWASVLSDELMDLILLITSY